MEPHRFRLQLDTLEARENPSATPADVIVAAQFAKASVSSVEQLADQLAGPLRTETRNQIKSFVPQVALVDAWAATILAEFQSALATQMATDPATAAALAPLAAATGELQVDARMGAVGADFLAIGLGAPSLQQQIAALPPPPTSASSNTVNPNSNTTDGSSPATDPGTNPATDPGTNTGTDPGTTKPPPLSTSDASGMSDTIPPLDDPHWQAMPDGLRVWDVVEGNGTPAQANSKVTVYYTGWLKSDGTQFETDRNTGPNTFDLTGLIKGWQEAIPGMKPGGLRRLDVPAALAYGSAGSPPKIPANADLVFEIKMLAVN
jgi:hypothetical protein